jgi:hypothetical protein
MLRKIFSQHFSTLNITMENRNLTIADMASLKSLIEAASTRGAFKASELSTVGMIYDKLAWFIEQSTAQLQAQQAQVPDTQGEANA